MTTTTIGPMRPGKFKEVKCKSKFYPTEAQGHHLRTFLDTVQEEFRSLDQKNDSIFTKWNLSKGEIKALKTLKENSNIVIRPADKGGAIVIQDFDDYNKEALNILSDHEYYKKITSDPLPVLLRDFHMFIKEALELNTITKEEAKFINVQFPAKPFLYHRPKIH